MHMLEASLFSKVQRIVHQKVALALVVALAWAASRPATQVRRPKNLELL